MSYETLDIQCDARGVATLTLARPDKHNAMNAAMIAELMQAARQLDADDAVRVVVLTGAGASFCAGGDLAWMQEQMRATPEVRAQEAGQLAWCLQALNTLSKPVIGALQGNAFGGGIGLACVCDVAIGCAHIKMGLTEVRLGLIPATIGPYVLARMGEGAARRVFFSGRVFGAEEAVQLGLLSYVVPQDALSEAVEREIAPYLSAAPGAVAEAKALTRYLGADIDAATINHTIAALKARWESQEAEHGITAFFDKSAPNWTVDK